MKKIVIDPGHGGQDRSNVGYSGKYIEADGNLEFSLYLKEELQDFFDVILTREKDTTLSLTERANIAIKNNADMFISVHSDAYSKNSSGVTIFDSVDLENEDIAYKIGKACADTMGIPFRGCKERESNKYPDEDYYTVIDVAQDGGIPIVLLIERGFHSNPHEERLLLDSSIVKKSAIAVANEIKKYYGIKNNYNLIKLQSGRVIKAIKTEDDYLIPLSEIEDILMPISIVNYDKVNYDNVNKEGDFVVLKRGSRGDKVRELQEKLVKLGHDPNGIDGIFGRGCEKAVKQFQQDFNLTVDGIVGRQTWSKIEELLNEESNKNTINKNYKYYKEGITHIVELNPMDLRISTQDKPPTRVSLRNFVTSGYQWHNPDGVTYPLGILVSEGKVISNRQPHAYIPEQWLPAGTLLVYEDGTVKLKELSNLNNEKNVWFAVSGCSIYPEIKMKSAGFTGKFADIARTTNRPIIGYRSKDNKIVIAVRSNSNIGRAKQTAFNLGLDFAITLDAGGSTCLRVDNKSIFSTTRRLYSLITW